MRICFQSFLITNQFKTQLINSPPPPSWTYKNRYILFLCRSESSKFSHSLKFIKTFLKFAMANRSPETTANGQSSETTVRVLLRFCSNRFYQAVETLNCFHAYPFLGSSQCIQWVILISVEMLMIDEEVLSLRVHRS